MEVGAALEQPTARFASEIVDVQVQFRELLTTAGKESAFLIPSADRDRLREAEVSTPGDRYAVELVDDESRALTPKEKPVSRQQ